ncbi:MAG: hypothetical protein C5B60_05665 [Chloroflexi bacterium]|nr:MAG: hypothetical protein C5B60_05665 [Chloroflexota bacterium]
MVALRTLAFSIFVPGMVAIGLPYLYLQAQAQLAPPSLVSAAGISGSLLVVVGVALYAVLLFGLFHLFITAYEEPTLHRLFGNTYTAYQHAVPRWLRLWPEKKG